MTDLWPADLASVEAKPPSAILKEQASLLGRKTKNIVKAQVLRSVDSIPSSRSGVDLGGRFIYLFVLSAPALGDYRYRLFAISYDVDLYPVEFLVDDAIAEEMGSINAKDGIIARDEKEFIDILSKVLRSQRTRKVVQAIFSQSLDQPEGEGGAAG